MTLGERIKLMRLQYGYSLTELSRRSGVSRQYLYNVERDQHDITVRKCWYLARAFDMTVTDFLAPVQFSPEISVTDNGHYEPLPFEDVQS